MSDIITMKCEGKRDCAVAAIGTACKVTYDQAHKALGHRDLPGSLESPILSNPYNLYRALINLGFWKANVTWEDIESYDYKPGETIVLVKSNFLEQHWIVLGTKINSIPEPMYNVYWGIEAIPYTISLSDLKKTFLVSWPNCAFTVYKASIKKLILERVKLWFKNLFVRWVK